MNKADAKLQLHIEAKIKELIQMYFDNQSEDAAVNQILYDALNTKWKQYVYKVRATQKRLKPNVIDFKLTFDKTLKVMAILKKSPLADAAFLYSLSAEQLDNLHRPNNC